MISRLHRALRRLRGAGRLAGGDGISPLARSERGGRPVQWTDTVAVVKVIVPVPPLPTSTRILASSILPS